MRNPYRTHRFAALAGMLLFVVGCSELPTQPKLNDASTAPPQAELRSFQLPEVEDAPTLPSTSDPLPVPQSAQRSVFVNGIFGGTVSAGRFTVIIPPAAFIGVAKITVTQPDLSQLRCDLDIFPAARNHFLLPVLLVADASTLPSNLLSVSTIQWWDPTDAKWVDVPGASVNVLNLTVSAPLMHFSQYRVEGRAGW